MAILFTTTWAGYRLLDPRRGTIRPGGLIAVLCFLIVSFFQACLIALCFCLSPAASLAMIAIFSLVLILGHFSPTRVFERDVFPSLEDKADFIAGTVIL